MKRIGIRLVTAAVLVSSFVALGASLPALAACGSGSGHFCAYKHANYGTKILDSGAGAGNEVDVADDQVSSGKNWTGNHWCGMTNVILLPPALVFDFNPSTNVSYVGDGDNDRIDFFDVKSSNC